MASKKTNPTQKIIAETLRGFGPLLDNVLKLVYKYLDEGETVDVAVKRALKKSGFTAALQRDIVSAVEKAIQKVGSSAAAVVGGSGGVNYFRKTWLNKTWPGDKLTLSQKITAKKFVPIVADEIKRGVKAAKSWNAIAGKLTKQQLQKGDVSGYMRELVDAAKRAAGGDPGAVAGYVKAVKKAEANIARLARGHDPGNRLKAAYADLVKATKSASAEAIEKAVARAVKAKARYNVDRIVKTEIARAYGVAEEREALDDDDVIGLRWVLSSTHKIYDICDFNAGANLYGLGAGGYPKESLPAYPAHPHCTCVLEHIVRGNAKNEVDGKAAQRFLNSIPAAKRKQLLGVEGARQFNDSPESWRNNLKMYSPKTGAGADEIKKD